jgi:adenosylcobinamide kinase/adenosylcobinamide-phosphate guanylyltransferase
MITLVLGPVRAGKSARATALARSSRKQVLFVATAALDPDDAEMRERVARHRRDRPPSWTVVETAVEGGPSLPSLLDDADGQRLIVIDALGTWIAAQLHAWESWAERDIAATLDALDAEGVALVEALQRARADVVVVAEETGWGLVPSTPLGRLFRDALGRLTQRVALIAERVELVVAGYAIDLRALGTPVGEA